MVSEIFIILTVYLTLSGKLFNSKVPLNYLRWKPRYCLSNNWNYLQLAANNITTLFISKVHYVEWSRTFARFKKNTQTFSRQTVRQTVKRAIIALLNTGATSLITKHNLTWNCTACINLYNYEGLETALFPFNHIRAR